MTRFHIQIRIWSQDGIRFYTNSTKFGHWTASDSIQILPNLVTSSLGHTESSGLAGWGQSPPSFPSRGSVGAAEDVGRRKLRRFEIVEGAERRRRWSTGIRSCHRLRRNLERTLLILEPLVNAVKNQKLKELNSLGYVVFFSCLWVFPRWRELSRANYFVRGFLPRYLFSWPERPFNRVTRFNYKGDLYHFSFVIL